MTALPPLDTDQMVQFLVELLNTPSPTGDTERAIALIKAKFIDFGLDMLGNRASEISDQLSSPFRMYAIQN